MKRRNPEQTFHRTVAAYLTAVLPEGSWWTTIPAGGGGRLRGAILNGLGYKAGTPDILVIYRGMAVFIELKAPTGTLSADQRRTIEAILATGADAYVCRTLEQVTECLRFNRIPLRGRIAA